MIAEEIAALRAELAQERQARLAAADVFAEWQAEGTRNALREVSKAHAEIDRLEAEASRLREYLEEIKRTTHDQTAAYLAAHALDGCP